MIVLRSAIYNLWFVAATVAYGLVGLGVRVFAPQRALPFATAWVRALLWGVRAVCGIRTVVIGRENLPEGPVLIASQHQSAFDTLVWMTLVPRPAYIFKAELARIPLFGPMLPLSGQIPLDRGAGMAPMRAFLRAAAAAADAGRQIIIFPEGTRVAAGVEVTLRPGVAALAARMGVPVVPVATDSGGRWSRRAFIKRPGPIHIVIGPPLPPGLRQEALLDGLRAAWTQLSAGLPSCG